MASARDDQSQVIAKALALAKASLDTVDAALVTARAANARQPQDELAIHRHNLAALISALQLPEGSSWPDVIAMVKALLGACEPATAAVIRHNHTKL